MCFMQPIRENMYLNRNRLQLFYLNDRYGQSMIEVDYLILGAGLAGLHAAIDLNAHGTVAIVSKRHFLWKIFQKIMILAKCM